MNRVHVALDVVSLQRAVEFYEGFLGVPPIRVLNGYAQFLLDSPGLNLALSEGGDGAHSHGHFGLEVPEAGLVEETLARVRAQGLDTEVEASTQCCYSLQEKFWVRDPDGHRWEVFWVRERYTKENLAAFDSTGCCSVQDSNRAGCCNAS